MNKKDLIAEISKNAGLPSAVTKKTLSSLIDTVKDAVKRGDDIRLIGFGTFSLSKRAQRIGINPQTKEKITLKPYNLPKFRPGKSFKKLVNID